MHFLDGARALVRRDSAWYMIGWRKVPDRIWEPRRRLLVPASHVSCWDALLKINIHREKALRIYGRPIHAVTARRAHKREVRWIVNSYPYTNLVR